MWNAGTASVVITPTEPYWLAGFAARTEPSKGKISDLKVAALALDDDAGGRLVIASADIIAITREIAEPVLERVRAATGLGRERIILAASHTHFGPEPRPDKALFFKIPPDYAKKIPAVSLRLIDALAQTITAALHALEPACLFARITTATFAHNRRRDGVKGGNPSKEDTLDQDVPILDVVDARTKQHKAIVFGYACHNTTIPPEDCRYCADWAGFARDQLERDNAGATALFITGCGADQNPEPRGSVELSRQYGKELADAIQQSLATSPGGEIAGTIRVAREDVPLALQPVTRADLQSMLASDDPPKKVKAKFLLDQLDRGQPLITSYAVPLQAIRFGDQLLMIVLPGEAVVDWSLLFKRRFIDISPTIWSAAYCNDMPGYLPTKRIQQEGGYEGGRANLWSWIPSPWTDDVESRITAAVDRLVAAVSN
jgi:hypothetical protein